MRVGEMIVTLPRTRSSTMKLRPVTSLTNLASTGSSTSWKLSATLASSAGRAGVPSAASRLRATTSARPVSAQVIDQGARRVRAHDVERDARLVLQAVEEAEERRGLGDLPAVHA